MVLERLERLEEGSGGESRGKGGIIIVIKNDEELNGKTTVRMTVREF